MDLRWLIDNGLNFTPHLVVLALAAAAFAIFGRHWPLAALSLVVIVAGTGYMLRSDGLLARAHACEAGDRITVATFNTRLGRADLVAFAAYLEAQRVDIVIVQELSDEDASQPQVEALKALFPHEGVSSTRTMRVFSRTPLGGNVEDYIVAPPPFFLPTARVQITTPVPVELYFMHGARPRSGQRLRLRELQFTAVEEALAGTSVPTLVVGDMNATVLSPAFASMLRRTDLRAAISGHRDSPSWPSVAGPLGVRTDHVLVRGFEVCRVDRGPSFGSDHHAIVAELTLEVPE